MSELSYLFSQYDRVVDLLPDMVIILDDENRIVDVNKTAVDALGVIARPRNRKHILDIIPDKEHDIFRKMLPLKDQLRIETKFFARDGSIMDASGIIRVLRLGQSKYWIYFFRDVTIEKQMELDLLRFSNVIQHTLNPIQITDPNGIIVYVNPAFEKITGFTSSELIGKNPRILSSGKHSKSFWTNVWQQIIDGKIWVGRIENKRKDGSPFFTELVISPIVDSGGKIAGYFGAYRDITEQIFLEKELVQSQRMESIGTLAAGIAHEVGNPLTAISSLVQVIQHTTSDEFAKEKLELINSQINRITRIIRELVDFSRPSTHIAKPTNINKTVKEALNIVKYGKKVKDITFKLELDDQLPEIVAVPDQLVQVFINILMNAIDALEGKQGIITIQSRWGQHQETDNGKLKEKTSTIEVAITDTGKGIKPEELEKIFEPFYTTKPTGQGVGLGLWVSYGIVKSLDGNIYIESNLGKGSTFIVSFPYKGD